MDYRAPCRFYPGDTRNLQIQWTEAPPGAEIYEGVTPFAPWLLDAGKLDVDDPDDVGETYPWHAERYPVPPWHTGDHQCGTDEQLAGKGELPPLNDDGTVADLPRHLWPLGGVGLGGLGPVDRPGTLFPAGGVAWGGAAETTQPGPLLPVGGVGLGGAAGLIISLPLLPVGGVGLGGNSPFGIPYSLSPAGGVALGGAAQVVLPDILTPAGGVAFGGAAQVIVPDILTPAGGVAFGGESTLDLPSGFAFSAGVAFGGAGEVGLVETIEEPTGASGVAIGGSAAVLLSAQLAGSGGVAMGGTATLSYVNTADASGGVAFGGASTFEAPGALQPAGGVALGGAADVRLEEDVPIGAIAAFAGLTPPTGYLLCDGAIIAKTTYPDLWAALSLTTTGAFTSGSAVVTGIPSTARMSAGQKIYGPFIGSSVTITSVNSSTQITMSTGATGTSGSATLILAPWGGTAYGGANFALPDLRGVMIVGAGVPTLLSTRFLGSTGGEETHLLTTAEMPAHTHDCPTQPNTVASGSGNGQPGAGAGAVTTTSTGGGTSHNNMPPFAACQWVIRAL